MGSISETERHKMLKAMCANTVYQVPGVFVQLHTADPGSVGTANIAPETERPSAPFASEPSAGTISNSGTIEWVNMTGPGTLTHVSLWSASSSGTFLGSDDLSSSAVYANGDTFRIPLGELKVSVGGTV